MTTATLVTCDARTGVRVGDWGDEEPLWCNATVGLTRYTDTRGVERAFCRHHGTFVLHRFPAAPPVLTGTCDVCHKRPVDDLSVRIQLGASLGWACWRCQDRAD